MPITPLKMNKTQWDNLEKIIDKYIDNIISETNPSKKAQERIKGLKAIEAKAAELRREE